LATAAVAGPRSRRPVGPIRARGARSISRRKCAARDPVRSPRSRSGRRVRTRVVRAPAEVVETAAPIVADTRGPTPAVSCAPRRSPGGPSPGRIRSRTSGPNRGPPTAAVTAAATLRRPGRTTGRVAGRVAAAVGIAEEAVAGAAAVAAVVTEGARGGAETGRHPERSEGARGENTARSLCSGWLPPPARRA